MVDEMSRTTILCIVGYSILAGIVLRATGAADYSPEAYAGAAGSVIVAVWGVFCDAWEGL
jgi:hypothetical protein